MTSPLWAVLPGGIDDPAAPSGGNRYDRIVLDLLSGAAQPGTEPPSATSPPPRNWVGASGPGGYDKNPPSSTVPASATSTTAEPDRGNQVATRDVHEIGLFGTWPTPGTAARSVLTRALADIPDKSDVLVDGLVACGVPELLEPHARRLRLIVLVHLPLSDETGLPEDESTRLQALERRALHLADTVIATSNEAAAHISEMHGLSGVRVAAPGVEPAAPATPDPAGQRLLCVASVTHRKGQALLVTALEQHLADLDWRCTFVGALRQPVPYTDERIHFAGPLVGAELEAAYADADLFVLASHAETYGMVVTEALAHAVPVLATEVGGVPGALGRASDGRRPGRLVPPGDPTILAAALREWLTDPAVRESWRAAARDRRRTLPTWTETARRLAAALDR